MGSADTGEDTQREQKQIEHFAEEM
jgi:hypothetical protein